MHVGGIWLTVERCFLYLVNYARIKPEAALKALPVLVQVGEINYLKDWLEADVCIGHERYEPTRTSSGIADNILRTCPGIRSRNRRPPQTIA
jgi:hypothetical protein